MKVLIADDESIVRLAIKRALQRSQVEVIEAENGELALQYWREHNPDLVFLDVLMPGLTGPQVLDEIQDRHAKIILMSAYTGEYNIEKARSLGADLFVAKPFEDIFAMVDKAKGLLSE